MPDGEFQAASLAIREWTLWVAMTQVAISAIQTGIVYYGIRAMIRATNQRGLDSERDRKERAEAAERDREERAEAAAAARREADRRHAEAMQASAERHAEAMKAGAERHAENMAAINAMAATLAETTTALKVVVERTAPGAGRQPE